MTSSAATLRQRLAQPRVLHAPGVYDAVTAALVRAQGFEAAYLSGATASATALGLPDLGYLHATDVVGIASRVVPALKGVPLVADADTGYGSPLQARRTAQMYAAAGIAALHIEDQASPKRCGHMAGKEVVGLDEACQRVRAAVEADSGVVIIARTDVLSLEGLDAAAERAAAFARLGADLVFVEGVRSPAEIAAIQAATDGVGMVLNRSEAGGRTDDAISDAEAADLGVRLVIHPLAALLAAARAAHEVYAEIGRVGHAEGVQRMGWSDVTDLLGLPALMADEARYS